LTIERKPEDVSIQAGPAPGGGTRFEVCIPAALATPAAPQHKSAPQAALAPLSGRVLVADNDANLRDLIEFYLHELGLECRLVGDGFHAVNAAFAGKFDVLLMDLEMPVMDGFEATHLLRERGYQAPIIALTAHQDGFETERAKREGCNDVLIKPVTIEKLRETITPLLGGQGGCRSTAAPVPGEQEFGDEEILVKIDRKLAVLAAKFLADCRGRQDELRGAIESGDTAVTRRIGHSLWGTGSSYGFDAVGSLGEAIERAARAGDTEALRRLAERLDRYLARVRPVFD
jgi:CheY-like chemotaxis protein